MKLLMGCVALIAISGCEEQKKAPAPKVSDKVDREAEHGRHCMDEPLAPDCQRGGSPAVPAAGAPVAIDAAAAPLWHPTAADAVKVTTKQLFADYESNEVAADDKYKGTLLEVTGVVKKIAKDALDEPYVELLAGDRFGLNDVWAYFDDKSWLAQLKKGYKLVMLCRGAGMTLSSPLLKGCVVEHVYEWQPAR